ncbi:MAG: hypothetical protein IT455_10015 [Planctomycetes bacterium]|nr:hypothetical protein [Planctomycetota bacterium]
MRCLLLACCCATAAAQSLQIGFEPPAATRQFGDRVEVVVTRRWPAGAEVEAFDAAVLAPLELGEVRVEPLLDGERLRFAARVLRVGDYAPAPVVMRWRRDGRIESLAAAVPPFVVGSLLPSPPGGIEWLPPLPPPSPFGRWAPAALGGAAVLLGLCWWWRRRRLAPQPSPFAGAAGSGALEALLALPLPAPGQATEPYCLAVKRILRQHLASRFHVPAVVRTSEELVAAVPVARDALRAALHDVDLVLFAAARGDATCAEVRDHATAFVRSAS